MGTIECNIGDIPSSYKEINCSKDTSDTSDSIRAFMCKPGFKRKEGDNTIIINNVPTAESCKFTTSPSLKCEPIPYKLPNIIRPDKTEHFQCSVTDLSSSTKENIKTCFKKNIDTEYSKLRKDCNDTNGCTFQRYKGDYLKKKEVYPEENTTTELISFEEGNKLFPQATNGTRVCWPNSSLPKLSNNTIKEGTITTSAKNSDSTCITLEHLTYNKNLSTTMDTNKSKIERGQNIEISNTTDNSYIGYEISDKSNNKFIGTTVYDTLHKIDPTDSNYNYYPGSTPPSSLSEFRYNCSSRSYFNGYNVVPSVSDNSILPNPSNLELYGCEMNTCFDNNDDNNDDRFRTIFNYLSTDNSTGYTCTNSDSTSFFTCGGDKEKFGIYHDNDCTSSTITTNFPSNDIPQLQCNYCGSIDIAEECNNNSKCYWYQSAGESLSMCKNKCEARNTLGECEQFYKENNDSISDTIYDFDGRDNSCIWIPNYFNNDRSSSSTDGKCRDKDSPCFPTTSLPESSPCEIKIPSKDIPLQGTSHNGFCYLNESDIDRYLTDPYCAQNYINKNEEECITKDICGGNCNESIEEFRCVSDGEPYIKNNIKVYTSDKDCLDIKDPARCLNKPGCISIPSQSTCEAKSISELINGETSKYKILKDVCKPLKAQVPVNYDPNLLEEEGLDLGKYTEKHNVEPPFITSRYLCDVCTIRDKDINYIKANPTDPHYNINTGIFNSKNYCEKPIDKYDIINERRPCVWLEDTETCISRCKKPFINTSNPSISVENMNKDKETCAKTLQFSDEPLYNTEFPNIKNGQKIEDDYYKDMYCSWDGFECHNSIPCKEAQRTRCEDLGYNWYIGTAEDINDQLESAGKNPEILSTKFPTKHKGDGKPIIGDSQGICVFPNTKAMFVGASAEYTIRTKFKGHQGILLRWKEFGTNWNKDNSLRRRVSGGIVANTTNNKIDFNKIHDITGNTTYVGTEEEYLGDNLIFIPFEIDGGETDTEIQNIINKKLTEYEYFSVNGEYVVYAKTIYKWAMDNYKDIWYKKGNNTNSDGNGIGRHVKFRTPENKEGNTPLTSDTSDTVYTNDTTASDIDSNNKINSLIYHYGGYLYYRYGDVRGLQDSNDGLQSIRDTINNLKSDNAVWDNQNNTPKEDVMMANVVYDLRGIINLLPVINGDCVLEINKFKIEKDTGNIEFKMYPDSVKEGDPSKSFCFKTYQRFQFQAFLGHEILDDKGELKEELKEELTLDTYRKKTLNEIDIDKISNFGNTIYGLANLYEPFINEDRPIIKVDNIYIKDIDTGEIEKGYRDMSIEFDKWETNKEEFKLNGPYFVTVNYEGTTIKHRICKCSGSYEAFNYYDVDSSYANEMKSNSLSEHPLFKLLQYYNKSYLDDKGEDIIEQLSYDIMPVDIRKACIWSMCRPVHPAFGNLIYDPGNDGNNFLIKGDTSTEFINKCLPYITTEKDLFDPNTDKISKYYNKHLLDPFKNNDINVDVSENTPGMIKWSNLLRYLGKNYNKIVLYQNLPNPIPTNGWYNNTDNTDTTDTSWYERINKEGDRNVLSNNNSSTYYDKPYVTYIDLTPFDVTAPLPTINTNAFIHISDATPLPINYEQYFYPGKWVNPPTDTSWPTSTSSPGGYGNWDEITTPSGKLIGETNKELQRLKQLFGNSSTTTLQPIPSILGELDEGKFITNPDGTGTPTSNDILGRKPGELLTETQKKAWPKKGDLIDECDALNKYMDIQDDFILLDLSSVTITPARHYTNDLFNYDGHMTSDTSILCELDVNCGTAASFKGVDGLAEMADGERREHPGDYKNSGKNGSYEYYTAGCKYRVENCFKDVPNGWTDAVTGPQHSSVNYKIGQSIKSTSNVGNNLRSGELWNNPKPNYNQYTIDYRNNKSVIVKVDKNSQLVNPPYYILSRLNYTDSDGDYMYNQLSDNKLYYRQDGENGFGNAILAPALSRQDINLLSRGDNSVIEGGSITGKSIIDKWGPEQPNSSCGIPIPRLTGKDNTQKAIQVYYPESISIPMVQNTTGEVVYNSQNTNTNLTKMPIGFPINGDLGFSAEPNNNSNYKDESNLPHYPNWLVLDKQVLNEIDDNKQLTTEQCYNLLAYVPNDPSNTITNVSLDNCSLPLLSGNGILTGDSITNNISMFENNIIKNKTIRDVCSTVCQTNLGRPKSTNSTDPKIYEYTVISSQSKYLPSKNTHALFVIPTKMDSQASKNPIINAKPDNTYYIMFTNYYKNKIYPGFNYKPLKNLLTGKGQEAPLKTFYMLNPPVPTLCPILGTIPSCIPSPSKNNMFSVDELVKDIRDFTCRRELLNVIQSDCLDKDDSEFTECLSSNINVKRLCTGSDFKEIDEIGKKFKQDKTKLEPWLHLSEEQEPPNYTSSIKPIALASQNNPYNDDLNCQPIVKRSQNLSDIEFKKINRVPNYEFFKPRYGSNGVSRIFKNINDNGYGCIRDDIMNVEEDFFDLSCNTNTKYNIERNKFVLINAIIEESIKSSENENKLNRSDRTKLVLMNEEELIHKAGQLGLDMEKLNDYTKPRLVSKVKDIYNSDSSPPRYEIWDDLEQKYLLIDEYKKDEESIPSNIPKLGLKEWEFVGCGIDHNNLDSTSSFIACKDKYPGLCQKHEGLCKSTNPKIKEAIMLDCPETCNVQFNNLNNFQQSQLGDLSICSQHGRCKWSRDEDPANLLPLCDDTSARTYGDNDKCKDYESLTIGSCLAGNKSPNCKRTKCESMIGCEFTDEISKSCLLSNMRRDDIDASTCNHNGGRWTGQTDDIGSCLIPKYYDSTLSREQCNGMAGTYIEDRPASCIYNSQNWVPLEDPCSMPNNVNLNSMSDQEIEQYENILDMSIEVKNLEPVCIGSQNEIDGCKRGEYHPGGFKLEGDDMAKINEGDYIHITSKDLGEQCSVYLVGYSKVLKKDGNTISIKGPSQSYTLEQDPFNPNKYDIGKCIIDKAFRFDDIFIDHTKDIKEEYSNIKEASDNCTNPMAKHGGSCTYIYGDDPSITSGSCKSCSLIKSRDECVDKNITSTCGWGEVRDICESIGNIGECNDMYVDGCYWDKEKEMCLLNSKRKEVGCTKCGDIKHNHTCNSLSNCFFDKQDIDENGNGICKSCYEHSSEIIDNPTENDLKTCSKGTEGKCQLGKDDDNLFRCRPAEPYPFIYEWIWYNKFLLLSICLALYMWWKIPLDKFSGALWGVMAFLKAVLIIFIIPILFIFPGITRADGEDGRKFYVDPPINQDNPGYFDFLRTPDMKGAIWPSVVYDNKWDDKIMDNDILRNMIDLEIWPNSLNWSKYLFWKPIRAWNYFVNINQNNEVIIIIFFILAIFLILIFIGTGKLDNDHINALMEKSNPKKTISIIITIFFTLIYINYVRKTYYKSIYEIDGDLYNENKGSSNPTELNKTTNLVKYYGRQELFPGKNDISSALYTKPTVDDEGNSIHVCPVGCRLYVSNVVGEPLPTNTSLHIGDTLYNIFPTPVDFPACGETSSVFSLGGKGYLTEILEPNAKVIIDHYDHSEPSSINNWILHQGDTGVNYICPKEQEYYKWPYDEICLDTRNQCKAVSYNVDKIFPSKDLPSPSMNKPFTGRSRTFIDKANDLCDSYHRKYGVCETYDKSEFKDDLIIKDNLNLAPPDKPKDIQLNCNTVPTSNVNNCPFPENTVYIDYYGDIQRQPIKLWKDTYNYYFGPTPHRRLSKSEKIEWQNEERYEIVDQNYMADKRN